MAENMHTLMERRKTRKSGKCKCDWIFGDLTFERLYHEYPRLREKVYVIFLDWCWRSNWWSKGMVLWMKARLRMYSLSRYHTLQVESKGNFSAASIYSSLRISSRRYMMQHPSMLQNENICQHWSHYMREFPRHFSNSHLRLQKKIIFDTQKNWKVPKGVPE